MSALIEIRNFQSIAHVAMDLDGFTVLGGRSGLGKSAFVRAVKAALTGASGVHFVRHSSTCDRKLKTAKTCECKATVRLKTETLDLLWEKGDKINRYTVNGVVHDRAERGTPDFLERPAIERDFGLIQVANNKELLQVADQFKNVFLLTESGGTVADVLSDVANLDCINQAMRLVERDRKEVSQDRKRNTLELEELEKKATDYTNLDLHLSAVKALEETAQKVEIMSNDTARVSNYLESLDILTSIIDALDSTQVEVPAFLLPEKLGILDWISRIWNQVVERGRAIKHLQGVTNIPNLDLQLITNEASRYSALIGWEGRLSALKDWFQSSKAAESTQSLSMSEPHQLYSEVSIFTEWQTSYHLITQALTELETVNSRLDLELGEIKQESDALGVCPTCYNPIQGGLCLA